MSAFAALTLKNNANADVVFSPLTINSQTGVASWGTAVAAYDNKSVVTMSSQVPTTKSTKARAKVKVTVPYLVEDVNYGNMTKIDDCIIQIDIAIPKNMDSAARADAQAYLKSVVAHAILTAFVTNFEGIY
jgi:hypothetical protein